MVEAYKSILPNGKAHVQGLLTLEMQARIETDQHLIHYTREVDIIGTSLNALYQAATCERKCYGGGHLLERLCGRAYNTGQGAFCLTMTGLYHEALNLVRGLGEISNLIALSAVEEGAASRRNAISDRNALRPTCTSIRR